MTDAKKNIHFYARKNSAAEINKLIESKVDVNEENKQGASALMIAAEAGNDEACMALLFSKANVNHTNNDGQHSLMRASDRGNTGTVKLLIKAKADVAATDKEGQSAYDKAALWGHEEIMKTCEETKQNVLWRYVPQPIKKMVTVKGMKTFLVEKMVKVKKMVRAKDKDGALIKDENGKTKMIESEVEELQEVEEEKEVDIEKAVFVKSEELRLVDFTREVDDIPTMPHDGNVIVLQSVLCSVDTEQRLVDGEIVAKAVNMDDSVSPVVAKVIEARKDSEWELGDYVIAKMGWKMYSVEDAKSVSVVLTAKDIAKQTEAQKKAHKKRSRALGLMGPPGQTAYFGMFHVGKAKKGMTIFCSGASSVIGSVAGQMTKANQDPKEHLRIYGSCARDEQVAYLKKQNRYDVVIPVNDIVDHHVYTTQVMQATNQKKIDLYLDNTGGLVTAAIMNAMNPEGTVVILAQTDAAGYDFNFATALIRAGCEASGLNLYAFHDKIEGEFEEVVGGWEETGAVKLSLTTIKGFDKLPDTLMKMKAGDIRGCVEVVTQLN